MIVSWQKNSSFQPLALGETQVDLWLIDLDRSETEWRSLAAWLSADEIERAGRFRFDRDRRRYVVARASLRKILGRYVDSRPGEVRFIYGDYGKPELDPALGSQISFNLSHSGEKGLLGVSRAGVGEVGVDIEYLDRHLWDVNETAESVFTEREIAELKSYAEENRVEPFLAGWTRKEAYLKGIGKGLALPLKDFSVTLNPTEKRPKLSAPGWQLFAFWSASDYISSIALPKPLPEPDFNYYAAN